MRAGARNPVEVSQTGLAASRRASARGRRRTLTRHVNLSGQ